MYYIWRRSTRIYEIINFKEIRYGVLRGSKHFEIPTSTVNKGKWTQDKHKAFLTGWEKYGNNWNLVAKVVSTRTAIQTKKHVQNHFHKNVETNAAASPAISRVPLSQKNIFWRSMLQSTKNTVSPSLPRRKPDFLEIDAKAHNKHRKSLPPKKKAQIWIEEIFLSLIWV